MIRTQTTRIAAGRKSDCDLRLITVEWEVWVLKPEDISLLLPL